MNTEKITFELNKSELQALFALLSTFKSSPLNDRRKDLMAVFIMKKVLLRITHKLMEPPAPGKNTRLKLQPAEAAALGVMLNGVDNAMSWEPYNTHLILRIQNIINQKLA